MMHCTLIPAHCVGAYSPCTGVCDCCDGSDELSVEVRTGIISKADYEASDTPRDGWDVNCPNTCGTTTALHNVLPQVLDFAKRNTRSKTTKKRDSSHMMRKHTPPVPKNNNKRRNVMGNSKQRANRFIYGVVFLVAVLILPILFCICSLNGVQSMWHSAYYSVKLFVQFVMQKCGCLRVNTEYSLSKDATHMV